MKLQFVKSFLEGPGKKWAVRLKNKYMIAIIAFVFWVSFFDQNNLMERIQIKRELMRMDNEREYYLEKIQHDAARLKELKTNTQNLEKFAREQYLMKRDDEDVFVIVYD
ncbi:MAG: septum formation initiator family protein [Bacteroidota bacterium]|nr:MAG: septum formation initiator family protein [Bacteroidota bacterium]